MNKEYFDNIENLLLLEFNKSFDNSDSTELFYAIGKSFNNYCLNNLYAPEYNEKKACYFSAEFLVGKLTKSNLFNTGLLKETEEYLNSKGRSLNEFENFTDYALGNGGLGRLAACFLDSAASCDIPLDGFGIRYKYGYFRQSFVDNKQSEEADNWLKCTEPFGIKDKDNSVIVNFSDYFVKAIPYIYLIPGFNNKRLNKLVLFESAAVNEFNYSVFDSGEYNKAYEDSIKAQIISASLYPNDNTTEGKKLRLRQQYFFSSASLQYIFNNLKKNRKDLSKIEKYICIQLNDTHPVISIPEFIRLMMNNGFDFEFALEKAKMVFAYTNHTVLAEALEKWDISLYKKLLPEIYQITLKMQKRLENEFNGKLSKDMVIIDTNNVHMANLACFISKSINGVAEIHSEIIKKSTLFGWYKAYPYKFNNKTNGVTQRRWLFLSNPELYSLLQELTEKKITEDFTSLKLLEFYSENDEILERLYNIRKNNKVKICEYIYEKEGIRVNPEAVFDVQIKRLHEYKRQLMNILSIIIIYNRIKKGSLTDFPEVNFIFGAKAAPGYFAAKRIIEFINCVSKVINNDDEVKIKIVFVSNYDVSYAEKIIPSADISEQISLAGKEASGTSNMKFMMNGAVTLGTLDGANIEIVEKAGYENNYIFGLTEHEVQKTEGSYVPKKEYNANREIKKVVDSLIDNSFCKENNAFRDLYDSLLNIDKYYVLKDLIPYTETRIRAIKDTQNKHDFMKKCLYNTANSAGFSSDRTIKEYADEIWFKEYQEAD